MSEKSLYVYRFLEGEETVYVGRTNNISSRFTEHSGRKFYRESTKWEYIKFNNSVDQKIAEMYLINKLKPKYNIEFKEDSVSSLTIDLPEFTELTEEDLTVLPKSERTSVIKHKQAKEEQEVLLGNGFRLGTSTSRGNKIFINGGVEIETTGLYPKRYQIAVEVDYPTRKVVEVNEGLFSATEAYEKCLDRGFDKYFNNQEKTRKGRQPNTRLKKLSMCLL